MRRTGIPFPNRLTKFPAKNPKLLRLTVLAASRANSCRLHHLR